MKWYERKGFTDMLRVELDEAADCPGLVEDLFRIIRHNNQSKQDFINELHSIESKLEYIRGTMEGPMT